MENTTYQHLQDMVEAVLISAATEVALDSWEPNAKMKTQTRMKLRVECRKSSWDQGFLPLIIKNLEMSDSGNYICDVQNKKEVQLLVFRLTVKPGDRLRKGENLTLALDGPSDRGLVVKWKDPFGKIKGTGKTFYLPQVGFQESGTWICDITLNQKSLELHISIMVLDFKEDSITVYKKNDDPVEFTSALTFDDEDLGGELKWQAEGASSPKSWITFSYSSKDRKVSTLSVIDKKKFQMSETLPLRVTLPHALPEYAGSGVLTLNLKNGNIHQKVNLVVMKVTQSESHLICEVLGPTSNMMTLSLQQNQKVKVSEQQKVVQMPKPENGTWLCQLSKGKDVLLESKVEITVNDASFSLRDKILAAGVSGGLLIIVVLLSCCFVKCRHRRRKAERMSQIKKLLSEKKTCQCPHRLQKTCSLS
ncbi:PREDICTED: T-cell surface glycoprotein CD4 [Elephantulus edwardii]|uniref:T-cell surface glycoprotein CD4 n=1 Tax=Elephantulus edwardii TaxID=28737 RepID=UPI0003F0BF3B|nr:PREDICTED: T-cell surface glycoprotein CD4 [Elephantulus edwardii]